MKEVYRFGMVGHNTAYSKSPDIFKAIFAIKDVTGSFVNLITAPEEFETRFRELTASDIQGLSVTIPYKRAVIPFLDDIDPVAKALEAVNSVWVKDGKLNGFNTDSHGFSLALRPHAEKLKLGRALVYGCGGVAKAAIYSLYTYYEVKEFTVVGRSIERLDEFRKSLQTQINGIELKTIPTGEPVENDQPDIIVNCTPVGGWNNPENSPFPIEFNWPIGKIYYDLNYNAGNQLVAAAKSAGIIAIDGSMMLVGQAIRSFNIWTGEDVAFDDVYQRVFG